MLAKENQLFHCREQTVWNGKQQTLLNQALNSLSGEPWCRHKHLKTCLVLRITYTKEMTLGNDCAPRSKAVNEINNKSDSLLWKSLCPCCACLSFARRSQPPLMTAAFGQFYDDCIDLELQKCLCFWQSSKRGLCTAWGNCHSALTEHSYQDVWWDIAVWRLFFSLEINKTDCAPLYLGLCSPFLSVIAHLLLWISKLTLASFCCEMVWSWPP